MVQFHPAAFEEKPVNLFDDEDEPDKQRLRAAGWTPTQSCGQERWRSPPGRIPQIECVLSLAIMYLEAGEKP